MRLVLIAILLWAAPVFAQSRPTATDPISQLPPTTVIAIVDGEPITVRALDEYVTSHDARQLFDLNQQLFDLRQSMLGLMLGERLLKAEAISVGKSVDELIESVIKIGPATEEEMLDVYNNTQQTALDYQTARPMIANFLERKKRAEGREKYIQGLIRKAKKAPKPLAIYLQPPRLQVDVAPGDPVKGSGSVELVEFSDFECPYCQKVQPVLKQLLTKYDGRVKHVWKDFPLGIHKNAVPAAVAARCAHEQGKFWEYHDALFANQQALEAIALREHAGSIGLDIDRFNGCFNPGSVISRRAQLMTSVEKLPVRSTPTILINGRMIAGLAPMETYERIIEEELAN